MRHCIQHIGRGQSCSSPLPSDKDERHEYKVLSGRRSDFRRVHVFDDLEHLQRLQKPRWKGVNKRGGVSLVLMPQITGGPIEGCGAARHRQCG